MKKTQFEEKLQKGFAELTEIGLALSKEREIPTLLEKILLGAKRLTHADGGTIYFVTPEKMLRFAILVSDSLKIHMGGTSATEVSFSDLPLFLEDGKINDSHIVAYTVHHKETINIEDAYEEKGFDFSGTKSFDEMTKYRTKAVLTIPMKNHEDEVIAVLQLINPLDPETSEIKTFSPEDQKLSESLASQAGIYLTNQLLISNLKSLFESFIRVIADTIDAKSPSTANHSKRVTPLAVFLAEAVNETDTGPLKNIFFTKDELYELEVATFLHDAGKIITPVHVVEKKTRLETIFDRIELIKTRFDYLEAQALNTLLLKKLKWLEDQFPKEVLEKNSPFSEYEKIYKETLQKLLGDFEFLSRCNKSEVGMNEQNLQRLRALFQKKWKDDLPLITDDEFENLALERGTLNPKEREIIQNHVVMTYRMLSKIQYPKELRAVPEIAGSHHERMDGKGYPRGLKGEEIPLRARILIIADVFEALSAPDRPYKKALPLSQIFKMMQQMVDDGHLDPNLFKVFREKKVYLRYALRYLAPEQIDVE